MIELLKQMGRKESTEDTAGNTVEKMHTRIVGKASKTVDIKESNLKILLQVKILLAQSQHQTLYK